MRYLICTGLNNWRSFFSINLGTICTFSVDILKFYFFLTSMIKTLLSAEMDSQTFSTLCPIVCQSMVSKIVLNNQITYNATLALLFFQPVYIIFSNFQKYNQFSCALLNEMLKSRKCVRIRRKTAEELKSKCGIVRDSGVQHFI